MATQPTAPTTNVPPVTFTTTGFVTPQASDVLAGVFEDIQAAFGGGLNQNLNTPQGQLASSIAAIVDQANQTFQYVTTQFDPAYAQGRAQDALARIYFIQRHQATSTIVQAVCSGIPGTIIPVGAQAVATDGNIYVCTLGVVIGASGSVTTAFAAQNTGAINCPAGTLNQIFQTIPGWSSVDNVQNGIPGSDTETRQQFETRRQQSVALNATGYLASIRAAVLQVPGVSDCYVTENTSAGTVTIGGVHNGSITVVSGVVLQPNSVYVCPVGGDALAVATAIWNNKPPGCSYTGNTPITVQDSNSGYAQPPPAYLVTFQTPNSLPLALTVTLLTNPNIPSDAEEQIAAACVAVVTGASGGARLQVGQTILAPMFVPAVQALGAWATVQSIGIGSPNDPMVVNLNASLGGTLGQLRVTSVTGGSLSAGMALFDTTGAIMPGTFINSQLNGSVGGTGVYIVSDVTTVISPAEAMMASLPDNAQMEVLISQDPTLELGNVLLVIAQPQT